jgi:hypothetical protein
MLSSMSELLAGKVQAGFGAASVSGTRSVFTLSDNSIRTI